MLVINSQDCTEKFNVDRIREIFDRCQILDEEDRLIMESNLVLNRETIRSAEIQQKLIEICLKQVVDKLTTHWLNYAGRLLMHLLEKNSHKVSFSNFIDLQISLGIYSDVIWSLYTRSDVDRFYNDVVLKNTEFPLVFDYAGANLLKTRYLLPNETPSQMFGLLALYLGNGDISLAGSLFYYLSTLKLSLATPILTNLRTPNENYASCFILTVADDLDSIYKSLHSIAKISKQGGGVGVDLSKIRAKGSSVNGIKGASGGIIPWVRLINDTLVAVSQVRSRRQGAATVALECWHLDLPDFLELQTENGDPRTKAYDIFPQVLIRDCFLEAVHRNENWYLFDPYEVRQALGTDLDSLWGKNFEDRYFYLLNNKEAFTYKEINAKELLKQILKTQFETGLPYLAFKDTINYENPNTGTIPCTNLCVAPETRIFTDRGQIAIADLEGQQVNVWNGSEWSEVEVKQTGTNQPLLKVHFSNGEHLECTYYHHFWVQDSYISESRLVEAKDLKAWDKLIKYHLPLVESENAIDFPYAYTAGLFCGDGSYSLQGYPQLVLYGEKKKLVDLVAKRNKLKGNGYGVIETNSVGVYEDVKQDRLVCRLPLDLPVKYAVPLNGYTIKSRLEWLAGLLDTDGTVSRNGTNEALSISSINKNFLLEIRLLLQTLGVDSKVTKTRDAGFRSLPDGKGGLRDYYCQEIYRLLISSNGLFQLGQLGLKTHRLQWTLRHPQREANRFIQVVDVELTHRFDDTYCFTEPKRHLGMFNGILTGQCVESYSTVSENKHHVCNLISLNLANLTDEEIPEASSLAVLALNNAIDLGKAPTEEAINHNQYYRTIGVGAMGLADRFAIKGISYDSLEALEDVNKLFSTIFYSCIEQSCLLARNNPELIPDGYDKNIWNEIITRCTCKSRTDLDWVSLANDVWDYGLANTQLMAIAPNTSSAILNGCTSSVLPVFNTFFIDSSSTGSIPIAPPYIKNCVYEENWKLNQSAVIGVVAEIQKFVDSGISMELVYNLDDPNFEAKTAFDNVLLAWQLGCKAIYYTRSVQKQVNECTVCAN